MAVRYFGSEVTAGDIRALSPPAPVDAVAETLRAVEGGGDAALREIEERFSTGTQIGRVPAGEVDDALNLIDPELLAALELAIENVRTLAANSPSREYRATLAQGQTVAYSSLPVGRVAAYIPGGRGSYPSTAVMCLATAVEAGVPSICAFSPAREGGGVDLAVLSVCALLGVSEVYAYGGAQAIAAAAFGTETIAAADVVVGPGNSYVQEAKRQLSGRIGIDSIAGPSELVVVADAGADAEAIALDLLAQGEHGPDSLVALISTDGDLIQDAAARCAQIGAELALVLVDSLEDAVALADEIAPEHMQLIVAQEREAELIGMIHRAGALFVGGNAATAFGDYVVGSNHVLPTGGSARYASALSVDTFRRRMAVIEIPDAAVGPLADAGAKIARGEGFEEHAKSMEARKK